MPINDAIDRLRASARDLDAAVESVPDRREDFGERITQAVRHRVTNRTTHIRAGADDGESFAEKVRKAVEKKSGRKQHEDYVERERERYRDQPVPVPPPDAA